MDDREGEEESVRERVSCTFTISDGELCGGDREVGAEESRLVDMLSLGKHSTQSLCVFEG